MSQLISVKVRLQKLLWIIGFFFFTATPIFGQNAIKVVPANSNIGAASLYSIEFTLPDSLMPEGAISVIFPAEFDPSHVNIAGSSVIKGGLFTIVRGQEVLIFRKGEGGLVKRGERVDIKLAAVTNPESASGNHTMKVFIHRDGKQILNLIRSEKYQPQVNRNVIEGIFTLSTQ